MLLDQASRIYGGSDYFKPEHARVCYKRWKVLGELGRQEDAEKSASQALNLYETIQPDDTRELEALTDSDFDKKIMFWSR